jgi:hypothetical protein
MVLTTWIKRLGYFYIVSLNQHLILMSTFYPKSEQRTANSEHNLSKLKQKTPRWFRGLGLALLFLLHAPSTQASGMQAGTSQSTAVLLGQLGSNLEVPSYTASGSQAWLYTIRMDTAQFVSVLPSNGDGQQVLDSIHLLNGQQNILYRHVFAQNHSVMFGLPPGPIGGMLYIRSFVRTTPGLDKSFSMVATSPANINCTLAADVDDCIETLSNCQLVCNGSFEAFTQAPTTTTQLDFATRWYNPTCGTPDFFYLSGAPTLNNYPTTGGYGNNNTPPFANIYPTVTQGTFPTSGTSFDFGKGLIGLATWNDMTFNGFEAGFREYAQIRLPAPLTPNKVYYARMWVRSAPTTRYFSSKIGMYFSDGDNEDRLNNQYNSVYRDAPSGSEPLEVVPDIERIAPLNGSTNVQNNWERVSGCYTPSIGQANQQFLTIGNFRRNSLETSTRSVNSAPFAAAWWGGIVRHAYMLVDQISVVPLADAGADVVACKGDQIQIGPSCVFDPDLDGNFMYSWSPSTGLSDPTIPNPILTVSGTATYTLTVTAPDGTMASDQITISTLPYPLPLGWTLQFSPLFSNSTCYSGSTTEFIYQVGLPPGLPNGFGNDVSYTWTVTNGLILAPIAGQPNTGNGFPRIRVLWPSAGSPIPTSWVVTVVISKPGYCSEVLTLESNNLDYMCSFDEIAGSKQEYNQLVFLGNLPICTPYGMVTNLIPSVSALNGVSLNNRNVVVSGDFIIDQDFSVSTVNFTMGPGSRIIDNLGSIVSISRSHFRDICWRMWKGIYLTNWKGTFTFKNNIVEQAEEAIVFQDALSHNISANNVFKNNYKAIVYRMSVTNSQQANGPKFVYQNQFQSVTGQLHSPYFSPADSKTECAIEINDYFNAWGTNFTLSIGSEEGPPNLFNNVYTGIRVANSQVRIVNNTFQNILPRPITSTFAGTPTSGNAIEATLCQSNSSVSNQFRNLLTVGGNAANTENRFDNCSRGVYISPEVIQSISPNYSNPYNRGRFLIQNNRFNNLAMPGNFNGGPVGEGVRITMNLPFTPGTATATVTIQDNTFSRFRTGIHLTNVTNNSILITRNTLNNNLFNGINQAIWVNGGVVSLTGGFLNIRNNTIGNVRHGVWVQSMRNVRIHDNQINIPSNILIGTNNPAVGIYLANSTFNVNNVAGCEVFRNTVSWGTGVDPTSNNQRAIKGIYTLNSANVRIVGNTLNRTGVGLEMVGNHSTTTIRCNIFNKNLVGLNCPAPASGSNLNQIGTTHGSLYNPTGNQWIQNSSIPPNVYKQFDGQLASGQLVNWFYEFNGNFTCDPQYCGIGALTLYQANNAGYCGPAGGGLVQTPDDTQTPFEARDLYLKSTVHQDSSFMALAPKLRWMGKKEAYQFLLNNPDLVSLGTIDDYMFTLFVDSMSNVAAGQLAEVGQALAEADTSMAHATAEDVTPTVFYETKWKEVWNNYLELIETNVPMHGTSQEQRFKQVAALRSNVGGPGVFDARALLDTMVVETEGAQVQGRLAQEPEETEPQHRVEKPASPYRLVPNPAKEDLAVEGLKSPTRVEVLDAVGRIVITQTLQPGQPLKVATLLPGFYQLRIFVGSITQSLGFVKE